MKNLSWRTIKFCIFFLFCLSSQLIKAQVFDNFNDSISSSQKWQGDWQYFTFGENGLQSNCLITNAAFGLRTSSQFDTNKALEWRLKTDLKLETSSLNYLDFVLINNIETRCKYFIRIGNSKDEVALYFQDSTGNQQLLGDGIDKFTANTSLEIKVFYVEGMLSVFYKSIAVDSFCGFDAKISINSGLVETGFIIKQSTASFFGKHFIREIYFGPVVRDTIPPKVIDFKLVNEHQVSIEFDEPVNQNRLKLSALNSSIAPKSTKWNKPNVVELTFEEDFFGVDLALKISESCDLENNCSDDTIIYFSNIKPVPAKQFDVIITEIFPDPEPVVGLPSYEFVELYNTTNEVINLLGWSFGDRSKTEVFDAFILTPQGYVIVCDSKNSKEFETYGAVLGISSFPSLNNSGDSLWLKNADNQDVHSVVYSSDQYGSSWKKDGGWTLEMIDIEQPCIEKNWCASKDLNGGTPGSVNSVQTKIVDSIAPKIEYFFPKSEYEVELKFNKKIQVNTLDEARCLVDNQAVKLLVESEKVLMIVLPFPLEAQKNYNLQIGNIMDCVGNIMEDTVLKIGISQPIEVGDVLINEILFNPVSGSEDFVEIVNISQKILNLENINIGKKDSSDVWEILYSISETNRLFFPGEILALSTNIQSILETYPKAYVSQLVEIQRMPSLPDDFGNVGLALKNGVELDWISYSKNQHSRLTSRTEGASLERISLNQSSLDVNNWITASYIENYATPGYENSMRLTPVMPKGKLTLSPDPFSPNGDGYNDILQMAVEIESNTALYQIKVFDITGNQLAYPHNSARGSGSEIFTWNGLSENSEVLSPGIYVLVCEVFTEEFGAMVLKKPFTIIW